MLIKVRIAKKKKDSSEVAKVVLVNSKNEVLLLKRSNYLKKHAGELDLPGGHIKNDENILKGLFREVFEETKIEISKAVFYKKIKNTSFFFARYNSQEVILSDEHTDYGFYKISELNSSETFQKVAKEILSKGATK